MLKRSNDGGPLAAYERVAPAGAGLDVQRLLGMARRQWLLVAVIASAALAVAAIYLLLAQPAYHAKAHILLDTRKLQLFQQQSLIQDPTFDAPAVESQMELIRSEAIGATIVDEMQLADDLEFTGANPVRALAARVARRLHQDLADRILGPVAQSTAERKRAAIFYLRTNLQVQRVRTTYVIEIGFTSWDAVKAARVANAVAEAYILEQTQTKQYTTRRATNWLEERMIELRDRTVVAERAVQDFRTKNNLVRLGTTVVSEQQLAELGAQVTRAREQAAEIKARHDRVQEMMASRVPDASMSAWLSNDIINRLRGQYLDVTRREAEYVTRLGPSHEAVAKARKDAQQIERAAGEELRRIAQTLKAEYEGAQGRERAAEARLKEAVTRNEGTRQEQGALQVLESTSKTYQSLHDTFLQRYVEATTQQNFQSTEARVITPAANGLKIKPNPQQVLTLGAALGLMLGVGAAFARERLAPVLRTAMEAEQSLGVECLGVLPAVEHMPAPWRVGDRQGEVMGERLIRQDVGIARQVVLAPFSRFAETVRNVKVAADTSGTEHRIIGVTSALPGEGKSTLASNLAHLIAHGSSRTLLIDADLRQPSLSQTMAPEARSGLLQVLDGTVTLPEAVWHDAVTGLDLLPAVVEGALSHASEVLASRGMTNLIARAREAYDYVIVDFPPLAPVVDAKAAGRLVDGFVLVVEWGRTQPAIVQEALASAETVSSKLLGTVLNKADSAALRQLESYKGSRYHGYYTSA